MSSSKGKDVFKDTVSNLIFPLHQIVRKKAIELENSILKGNESSSQQFFFFIIKLV